MSSFVCGTPLSQFVHHSCQYCSVGSVWDVGDAIAYPSDQSRPKRAMWTMQQSNLSWDIHHVQCGPDECQTSRARVGKVKGCQERSLPGELNKCFMNTKQLAVCPPAVLKDQRFNQEKKNNQKKTEYRLIEGICIYLHSFWITLICLLLLEVHLQCPCLLFFFLHCASTLKQNSLSSM